MLNIWSSGQIFNIYPTSNKSLSNANYVLDIELKLKGYSYEKDTIPILMKLIFILSFNTGASYSMH